MNVIVYRPFHTPLQTIRYVGNKTEHRFVEDGICSVEALSYRLQAKFGSASFMGNRCKMTQYLTDRFRIKYDDSQVIVNSIYDTRYN